MIKIRPVFIFIFLVLAAFNLFSLGKKEKVNPQTSPTSIVESNKVESADTGNQIDAGGKSTVKITGKIVIYGNEPHTYAGIVDQNGTQYAIYPPSVEAELRSLQGYLLEITAVLSDEPLGYGSTFLKGGTVTPIKWEILQ